MNKKVFAGIQDKAPINVETLNIWRNLMRHKQKYDPSVFDVCEKWCLFSEFEAWTLFESYGDTLAHVGHVSDQIYHSDKTSAMVDANLARFLSDRNTKDYTRYTGLKIIKKDKHRAECQYRVYHPVTGINYYGSHSYKIERDGAELWAKVQSAVDMYEKKRYVSILYAEVKENTHPHWLKHAIRRRYMDVLVYSDLTLGKKGLTAQHSCVKSII